MRLIDADVLPRHGKRGGLVRWQDIEKAPTVDAIQIDWIKEYIRTHPASTDIYFKWMIDEWKEEQKKSYFPKGFFSKERPLAKGEEDETD